MGNDVIIKKVPTNVEVKLSSITNVDNINLYYDVVSHGVSNSRRGVKLIADNQKGRQP